MSSNKPRTPICGFVRKRHVFFTPSLTVEYSGEADTKAYLLQSTAPSHAQGPGAPHQYPQGGIVAGVNRDQVSFPVPIKRLTKNENIPLGGRIAETEQDSIFFPILKYFR